MPGACSQPEEEVLHVVAGGFWRRAVGSSLDLAILAAVFAPLAWGGGRLLGVQLPRGHAGLDTVVELLVSGQPLVLGALAGFVLLALLYEFLFLVARGQTPGKRLVGVRVITTTGAHPGPLRVLGRTAGYVVSALLLALGFLWIGFDREKRGLHDWLAGTYVVRS